MQARACVKRGTWIIKKRLARMVVAGVGQRQGGMKPRSQARVEYVGSTTAQDQHNSHYEVFWHGLIHVHL